MWLKRYQKIKMKQTILLVCAALVVTLLSMALMVGLDALGAKADAVPGIYPATPLPPAIDLAQPAPVTAPSAPLASATPSLLVGDPPYKLDFAQMYSGRSVRYGLTLSDYLKALDGQQVTMEGYMAPPLKIALDFFVLTEVPMSLCPFCSSNADWPDNIVLVYMNGQTVESTSSPIRVTGRLEVGSKVDDQTGFVSQVRIYADRMEVVN